MNGCQDCGGWRSFLDEAVNLAVRGCGHTRPNPPVGAVLVRDGAIIGRGWHRRCGGDHAEVAAIADAMRRTGDAASFGDCTLCVTLEPCSRPGRVGACTDAIVAAGIGRVVWGCADPNPANRNRAKRVLSRNGVACEFIPHEPSRELVVPFAKHVKSALPYVTVKIAMSLDGRICDDWGDAKWVSSDRARRTTGRLREIVDVVMVGAETVRRDDPSLLCHTRRNDDLWRAVVTKSGRLPKSSRIFTDAARDRTLVYRDAAEAVRDLGRRGFLHVLCEGGLELASSLAESGMVDEWITVLSSKVIGHRRIGEAIDFTGRNECLRD